MAEDLTRTSGGSAGGTPVPPSSSRTGGRFVAGTVLANRYRIVTLLGAGGMGEVYKAEDLKLDHPVALKFLPETLSLSPAALARFHGEVRIARQVSHPNVCRVYDIGDVDGLNFLTMEFIDGEDLASLLRRIGRLPADKAVEVARQLCAGLAAAHDAGVVHRDLKPHNVMIDGRGKARITDFGVAALAREVRKDNMVAGTPAYMAPEQLRGEDTTVRSDIYSLGLILYEVFTGKRAIQAGSMVEAVLHHTSGATVTSPSNVVRDVDPIVERVILRCLEKDPAMRPASAIQVAASLPGGDPLHAALAAGETPSPEMVAASGSSDAMRPGLALAIGALALAAIVAAGVAGSRRSLQALVSLDLSPDVLAFRARETLTALGYPDRGADSAFGFATNADYMVWDRANRPAGTRMERLATGRPAPLHFWYRDSPAPMTVVLGALDSAGPPVLPEMSTTNPPFVVRGMRYLKLDAQGRLVEFGAIPVAGAPAPPMDWSDLFRLAGLERTTFTEVDPEWVPATATDQRAAWTGAYPEQPDLPIRLEAAAFRGRLVGFVTSGPWGESAKSGNLAAIIMSMSLLLLGLVVAWFNVRAGRGDRRGAFRVAVFLLIVSLAASLLGAHHVAGREWFLQFRLIVCLALVNTVGVYAAYLAIEPHVRRRWPAVLVGWSRLLAGQIRDPLVGREVLAGFALAGALAVVHYAGSLATSLTLPDEVAINAFANAGRAASVFPNALVSAVSVAILVAMLVLVLRTALRSSLAAGVAFAGIAAVVAGASGMPFGYLTTVPVAITSFIALTRYGLLALIACLLSGQLLVLARVGLSQSAGAGGFVLALIAALIGAAVYVATGKPTLVQAGTKRQSA